MPSKPTVRRSAAADKLLGRPQKKAKLDVHEPTHKKPPPTRKYETDADEPAKIPASAKGKGKAREEPVVSTKHAKGTKASQASSVSLPTSFKVIAGSYEKLLYGLDGCVVLDGSEYTFTLKPMFIFPAHISCIKAVAASPNGGKWLATGSADEIVKVWDLRRRKEIGGLMHHEGT